MAVLNENYGMNKGRTQTTHVIISGVATTSTNLYDIKKVHYVITTKAFIIHVESYVIALPKAQAKTSQFF